MKLRYYLLHLGCMMNQSDAERIRRVLEDLGYERTEEETEAHVLGIVACSVRQKAIDRVYSLIYRWNKRKASENLLTFVSGCILPADKVKFLKTFDLVFDLKELPQLGDMIAQYGVVQPLPERKSDIRGFWDIRPLYSSSFEAFVPIQNGCDKFCTFCAVPYTRGREISRPSGDILAEVEQLIDRGCKSLTLLGQNVNSYGLDHAGEISFPRLLEAVGKMGEKSGRKFWVYFTSPHPRDMTRELLEVMVRYECLAKQVHLPLQSGDEHILLRMNRQHGLEQYRGIVHNIRSILPEATLFTDIIVGFTGETEEHFENTARAMREFSYNMAYIALYSPRPGAASSRWEDDVSLEEKKRRFRRLTDVLLETSLAYNRKILGTSVKILVEKKDRKSGFLSGKTEGKLIVRFPSDQEDLIGQFADIKITSASPLSLEGVPVSGKKPVLEEKSIYA